MTYEEFIHEFSTIIQVFGPQNFVTPTLERIHFKIKDMNSKQRTELYELILDNCDYAPKVPKVIELSNIIRARHREGPIINPHEEGPRTPEIARKSLATITNILANVGKL